MAKNTTTDLRSCLFYDSNVWPLNQRVSKFLFDQFGTPEIVLFASLLNTKCTMDASYKPDPDAYHVNAFSLCWSDLNWYKFSPFSIALAKLAQDWATGLVIAPCWQTQLLFPQLAQLGKPGTGPLFTTTHQQLPLLPGRSFEHPIWLSPVAALLLCTSKQWDCHLTLPRSSVHHGGPAHNQHTTPQCGDG